LFGFLLFIRYAGRMRLAWVGAWCYLARFAETALPLGMTDPRKAIRRIDGDETVEFDGTPWGVSA
jgi:hypothetical protein